MLQRFVIQFASVNLSHACDYTRKHIVVYLKDSSVHLCNMERVAQGNSNSRLGDRHIRVLSWSCNSDTQP
jgi:hypothetical protein